MKKQIKEVKTMINLIDMNWELVGAKLVSLSDVEQAEFFNGFATELNSWDTHYQKEMQMIHVNNKLKSTTKNILSKYLSAIWYEENDSKEVRG